MFESIWKKEELPYEDATYDGVTRARYAARKEEAKHWFMRGCTENRGRHTSGGVELTDEVIEHLAAEAEQGYDPATLKPRQVNEMDSVLQEKMDALAQRRTNRPKRIRDEDLYAGSAMHFYCDYCGSMSATLPESYDPRNYNMQTVHTCGDCQELQSMGVKLNKDWPQ
jgi:hypothetical protein